MSSCGGCSTQFLKDRIAAIQAQITALDGALLEFASNGGKQTVSVDTGQTRVSYTRSEISSIRSVRDALMNELTMLQVRTGTCSAGYYGR